MNNAAQTLAHVPNAGTTGATVYLPLAEAKRHNIPNHVHGVGPEIGED
jgi:hypothetical protein